MCLSANLQRSVADDRTALKFCKRFLPYNVNEAKKINDYTISCSADVGKLCENGWVQLRNLCYSFNNKSMSYDDAIQHCHSMKSTIVRIEFANLIRKLDETFGPLTSIWVNTSIPNLKYEVDEGDLTQIAYSDSVIYAIEYPSIIRVDRAKFGQTICEYTPNLTVPYLEDRAKKFKNFYFPGTVDDQQLILRTVGKHGKRNLKSGEEDLYYEENICRGLMKAFVEPASSGTFSSFYNHKVTAVINNSSQLVVAHTPLRENGKNVCHPYISSEDQKMHCENVNYKIIQFDDIELSTKRSFALFVSINTTNPNVKSAVVVSGVGHRGPMMCQTGLFNSSEYRKQKWYNVYQPYEIPDVAMATTTSTMAPKSNGSASGNITSIGDSSKNGTSIDNGALNATSSMKATPSMNVTTSTNAIPSMKATSSMNVTTSSNATPSTSVTTSSNATPSTSVTTSSNATPSTSVMSSTSATPTTIVTSSTSVTTTTNLSGQGNLPPNATGNSTSATSPTNGTGQSAPQYTPSSILINQCPKGFVLFEVPEYSVCHKLFEEEMTYAESLQHCNSIGAYLVEPHDPNEEHIMKGLLPTNAAQSWIGVRRHRNFEFRFEKGYSNDTHYTKPVNNNFCYVGKEYEGRCMHVSHSMGLYCDVCLSPALHVCAMVPEKIYEHLATPQSYCRRGFSFSRMTNRCLKVFTMKKSWGNALAYCQSINSTLAVLGGDVQRNMFYAHLQVLPYDEHPNKIEDIWLGIRYINSQTRSVNGLDGGAGDSMATNRVDGKTIPGDCVRVGMIGGILGLYVDE
ncbi:unnamed protein product [Caenorhabditis bovis]|uniref:C-type lectin domain-containing protein n=1 Tax=Caenorhabditis bovis TaxID=2654633 RepID=A0A8S1EZM1_9PELO|nr:unnamed protein product [Caenorhabditis bovis]